MKAGGFLFPLLLILSACATPTEPESQLLPLGWWTGETMLQVRQSDAVLYLTCGAGTFSRPVPDRSGSFRVDGRINISIGPPTPAAGVPATFTGQLSGSSLIVTMNSAQLNHTFTFHFDGVDGRSAPSTFCP